MSFAVEYDKDLQSPAVRADLIVCSTLDRRTVELSAERSSLEQRSLSAAKSL